MSKKKLIKPVKQKKEYFSLLDCIQYVEKKYKLEEGLLWSWLVDNYHISSNGSNMKLYYDELEFMDEKVKDVAQKLFDEFEPNLAEIEFEVYW